MNDIRIIERVAEKEICFQDKRVRKSTTIDHTDSVYLGIGTLLPLCTFRNRGHKTRDWPRSPENLTTLETRPRSRPKVRILNMEQNQDAFLSNGIFVLDRQKTRESHFRLVSYHFRPDKSGKGSACEIQFSGLICHPICHPRSNGYPIFPVFEIGFPFSQFPCLLSLMSLISFFLVSQVYMGQLRNKCVLEWDGNSLGNWTE